MTGPGDPAPEFTARSSGGSEVSLRDLRGSPVVLFFYPKAGSPGCTREAGAFARSFGEFQRAGVSVVGVSVDPPGAQARFAESCHLPFPLLSDPDGEVARSYGVLGRWGFARRVTFLLDANGTVVEVVRSPFPATHARRAIERWGRSLGRPSRADLADTAGDPRTGERVP